MKKLDRVVHLKVKLSQEYQILSRILFAYDKLEEEEDEDVVLEKVTEYKKSKIMRRLWNRRKYQQLWSLQDFREKNRRDYIQIRNH